MTQLLKVPAPAPATTGSSGRLQAGDLLGMSLTKLPTVRYLTSSLALDLSDIASPLISYNFAPYFSDEKGLRVVEQKTGNINTATSHIQPHNYPVLSGITEPFELYSALVEKYDSYPQNDLEESVPALSITVENALEVALRDADALTEICSQWSVKTLFIIKNNQDFEADLASVHDEASTSDLYSPYKDGRATFAAELPVGSGLVYAKEFSQALGKFFGTNVEVTSTRSVPTELLDNGCRIV